MGELTEAQQRPTLPRGVPGPMLPEPEQMPETVSHGPLPIRALQPQTGYELRRQIGEGGMGQVFEAIQSTLQRTVAIKTIRGDAWESTAGVPDLRDELRGEFEREALIAGRLEHPNIAPVHDLSYIGVSRRPHLVMKLVRGESWNRMIGRDRGSLTDADFLARHLVILERMCQAVAFAHASGIMHRDLKPSQVMVGEYGETVLMDWGLAVQFRLPDPSSESSTQVHKLASLETATNPAGTPCMMAPEQTEKTPENLGPHTDVFLLGGTLYFLITGLYPHEGDHPAVAMARAAVGLISPPTERTPQRWIPAELATLAMEALAPKPADRVPSAKAFLERLQDYLSGASRRRESESLSRQAGERLASVTEGTATAEAYRLFAQTSEMLAHSLELWSSNPQALELRGALLVRRIGAEIAAGDLLLAETHLTDLRAHGEQHPGLIGSIPALTEQLIRARVQQTRQQRQRRIFMWAATLLLLGHAIGMTISAYRTHRFARRLDEQKHSMALQSDRELRTMSLGMGDLLMEQGRPLEALPHYARALAISQMIEGSSSTAAMEAASRIDRASKAAASAPPPSTSE